MGPFFNRMVPSPNVQSYAEWGPFSTEWPLPPMPSQATMSLYYKPFGQSGTTFQHKGATFNQMNLHL